MAKSLRSKSKRAFRAKKRTADSSIFKQRDEQRAARLSKKLQESTQAAIPDAMQVDQTEQPDSEKKISTSGPRATGRKDWKAKHGIHQGKRLSQITTFNGRSQRRDRTGRVKA